MSAIDVLSARIGGPPGTQRRLARAGMAAAVLVTAGLVAITLAFILIGRHAAVSRAENEIAARTDLVAGQFVRALAEADRSLRYIELLATRGALIDEAMHPVLKRTTAELSQIDGIVVIDRRGGVISGSATSPPPPVNLADRTYFKAALADRSGGLHIGVPLRNRITANWILPMARALRGADGQVVAVVGASLSIDYFREVLGATLPAGGRIQLLRDDGIVMLREPAEDDAIGRDVAGRPLFRATAEGDRGVVRLTDDAGIERLVAFQRLAGYPLLITTGVLTDTVLRDWRLTSAVMLGTALALGSLIVFLAWLLLRGADRLIDQDTVLTEATRLLNATLAHMGQGVVVVDGGDRVVLANRRLPALLGLPDRLVQPGAPLDGLAAAAGLEPEVFAGAAGPEVERRLDDGRWIALQIDAMPGGRLVTLVDDISGRKAIEAELRQLVTSDPLTRLPNRRAFFERAAKVQAAMAASGSPAAVALVDVDHFKRLNDAHGHLVGDRALCAVADCMRLSVYDGDMVARIGGEEFAVLMPACPLAEAERTLERLRARVEDLAVPVGDDSADGGIIRCTVSIGLAMLGPAGADMALAAADRALYRAKSAGRNRVVVDGGPDPAASA